MNRIYLDSTEGLKAAVSLTDETYEAIQNSTQSAHIVAEHLPEDVAWLVVDETNETVEKPFLRGADLEDGGFFKNPSPLFRASEHRSYRYSSY